MPAPRCVPGTTLMRSLLWRNCLPLEVFDLSSPEAICSFELLSVTKSPDIPNCFAWSPCGQYCISASSAGEHWLYLFDVQNHRWSSFGTDEGDVANLAWSPRGRYIASASNGFCGRELNIWKRQSTTIEPLIPSRNPVMACLAVPSEKLRAYSDLMSEDEALRIVAEGKGEIALRTEASAPNTLAYFLGFNGLEWLQPVKLTSARASGRFWGFASLAFSPDESTLAVVAAVSGKAQDDWILLIDLVGQREAGEFSAVGHVADMSWNFNGDTLLLCTTDGTVLRHCTKDAQRYSVLPFKAHLCRCHPRRNISAFFRRPRERDTSCALFMADLTRMCVIGEYSATDSVLDMRWSNDGTQLYAASGNGTVYVCDCGIL